MKNELKKQNSASPRLRVKLILCALCVLCGLFFAGCAEIKISPGTPGESLIPPMEYSHNFSRGDAENAEQLS